MGYIKMINSNNWKPIGTVLGETDINEYFLALKTIKQKVILLQLPQDHLLKEK